MSLLALSQVSTSINLEQKAIYGDDNRKEIHQIQDESLRDIAALSNVALIFKDRLNYDATKGVYKIKESINLQESLDLCTDEPFGEQQTLAYCSGFIVGDNSVATAGHCIETMNDCKNTAFVVGFHLDKISGQSPTEFPEENVFDCKDFIKNGAKDEKIDFAILETDRFINFPPLIASDNKDLAKNETNLVLIGHPSGLPTKVSDNATVKSIYSKTFKANVDAFGGNSGSAIINQDTLEVEGILVLGQRDYVYDTKKQCNTRALYSNNSLSVETAVKASVLLPHL